MMIQPTIALHPAPETSSRRVAGTWLSETPFLMPVSATKIAYHPAFGNGDTPHYGL